MFISGYTQERKTGYEHPATVNRVGPSRRAIDAIAHNYVELIVSDAVESFDSTLSVITATAHSAKVGDVIQFTSGVANKETYAVQATTANTITLDQTPATAPSAADTFAILRFTYPQVNSSGAIIVSTSSTNTFTTVTHSTVAVQTSSTVVLAANTDRKYGFFKNNAAGAIYIFLGTPATTSGIILQRGEAHELNSTNLYIGEVTGIAPAGPFNLSVTEGQ